MTDPYGDTDLVALYDVDNPAGVDHDYYCALAETLNARRIIDLGCGTGLLTRALVRPGRSVTGIDPSRTMIDWARGQPRAREVSWVVGNASAIPASGDVDLVLCTGNTIMHLSGEDLTAALRQIIDGLRPGGVLSFECRNPVARDWEGWTREATIGTRNTSLGRLTEWIEVIDLTSERVTFEAHNVYLPTGEDRVYTSILYFRDANTYQSALHDSGFEGVDVDGAWTGEAATTTSSPLVFRARRP